MATAHHRQTGAAADATLNSFDSLAKSRSRSTRAASLALPARRGSSVNLLDDGQLSSQHKQHQQQQYHMKQPSMNQQQHQQQQHREIAAAANQHLQQFKLAPPSASSINIRRHSSHHCQIIDKVSEEQMRLQTLPVLPPAVQPARTKVNQSAAEATVTAVVEQPPPVPKRNFKRSTSVLQQQQQQQSPNLLLDAVPTGAGAAVSLDFRRKQQIATARYTCNQSSDEDWLNMDSPVFIELKSAKTSINPFLKSGSNRSSSDSNKSQSTIDTGYMTEATSDRIFFGDSVDVYRGRFSSVDTQSSLDSGCTDITKCVSPPLTGEPPRTANSVAPAVPKRRQKSGAVPPVPPARGGGADSGLDSPRILQNSSGFTRGEQQYAQEMQCRQSAVVSTPVSVANRSAVKLRHPARLTQRQDSNISTDSAPYSPGLGAKTMEQPLLKRQAKQSPVPAVVARQTVVSVRPGAGIFGGGSGAGRGMSAVRYATMRQDSTVSGDSVDVTLSPGYKTNLTESPFNALNAQLHTTGLRAPRIAVDKTHLPPAEQYAFDNGTPPTSPLVKSASTPASLVQYIDRNAAAAAGANASTHRPENLIPPLDAFRRKSSSPYVPMPKLNGRTIQYALNVAVIIMLFMLMVIFAVFQKETPPSIQTIIVSNKTEKVYIPVNMYHDPNPAPGICLPVIMQFCETAPYNFTVFPNFIGHFTQFGAEDDLTMYESIVDVHCYELAQLFLCTIFAPKCGPYGMAVKPCRILCDETFHRCGFFFAIFNLALPDYFTCDILSDSPDPNECVGWSEVMEYRDREQTPSCSAFRCDNNTRCIPQDWRCDGHLDCWDQSDEQNCQNCPDGGISCGGKQCLKQSMVCDGVVHCPFGQDERNCLRLHDRFGDIGRGALEVTKPTDNAWHMACVNNWDKNISPAEVCSLLGYSSVNSSQLFTFDRVLNVTFPLTHEMFSAEPADNYTSTGTSIRPATGGSQMSVGRRAPRNLLKQLKSCTNQTMYTSAALTCSNFECGRIRSKRMRRQRTTRIVGGRVSSPGDWPFIAALLGGPMKIFYCAGVLISDQWVLTASHCVGNYTRRNITQFTVQLGITRRHSYAYYAEHVGVRRVISHPFYNAETQHDNDIALVQLSSRVAFHDHIQPICLPTQGQRELRPGTNCTVIGWGKKELRTNWAAGFSYEPTINEVQVPIMNREQCNIWIENFNVTEGMICAGLTDGGKDACQGDSGGPLLCRDPDDRERWVVAGIVSWGIKCALPRLPGVYVNVQQYLPWIAQNMHRYSNN